jgi:LysR family nitrogen assimilation transcriptional regulator
MELRQLKYFAKIAELGSFTQAAAVLGVAQPALSRQIRDLEVELSVSLLLRNGRGVALTDAGVKFLARAKAILDDTERACQEARASKGRPMGLVSVGMPPSIGSFLAVPLVTRMRATYPEIQLQITEAYSGHLHEWLLSGRLDIGVLYAPTRSIGTTCDQLAAEELYLLGSPRVLARHIGTARRIEFCTLPTLPLILPARPHAIRRLMDEEAAKSRLDINLGPEVNGFLAIRDLVISGLGFTILPVSTVLGDIRAGTITAVSIVDPELIQMVGLMTSPHHPLSFAASCVVALLHELAQELHHNGAWPERQEPDQPDQLAPAAPKRIAG